MQAQKEVPSDMQSNEKFMIQSVIASPGLTAKEVTRETVLIIHIIDLMDNHSLVFGSLKHLFRFLWETLQFRKESGPLVEETKLKVTYVCPTTTNITNSPRTRRGFIFQCFC